jgi:hypothetical protein
MQGNIALNFLTRTGLMEDSAIIAKTRIETFRDICFALIAGLTICISMGSMAGCVSKWVSIPVDPIESALAQCLQQPGIVVDTNNTDPKLRGKVDLDAPALFKTKSDAVEKCRTMVFEFYRTNPTTEKAN